MARWELPESIADVLPLQARRVEELRRQLLDQFRLYGYEMVMPPLIEHLESLLTGAGSDLGLRTFKLVDQLSGRTLGVRADITPQVARIDAHLLGRSGVARLCYAGSVLHARPQGLFASREPIHVGAEVYGYEGVEADLEIVDLMVRSLQLADVGHVRVDLCHMGIVPALLEQDRSLDAERVYSLLQAKDVPGLEEMLEGRTSGVGAALLALTTLYGPATGADSVLTRARALLPPLSGIVGALDDLRQLVESPTLAGRGGLEISVDLADLRGYRYHSGVSFAAYVDASFNAIARGGRYDNVGAVFGRARPATGFSLELRELAAMRSDSPPVGAIRAPWSADPSLLAAITKLRAQGDIVIQSLPGHECQQQEFVFDRELVTVDAGGWSVRALADANIPKH